jgi:hypothetical protein
LGPPPVDLATIPSDSGLPLDLRQIWPPKAEEWLAVGQGSV